MMLREQLSDLLPTAALPSFVPGAWTLDTTEVELSVQLYGHFYVYRHFYIEWDAKTLQEALANLVQGKDLPLHYRVHAKGPAIHYVCNARRALMRRGNDFTYVDRPLRQMAAPWDEQVDDTLLEVWRSRQKTVMLDVGGRSEEDARQNWLLVAPHLRRMMRAIQAHSRKE